MFMSKKELEPTYEHDCKDCVLIGTEIAKMKGDRWQFFDFYFCRRGVGAFVARKSSLEKPIGIGKKSRDPLAAIARKLYKEAGAPTTYEPKNKPIKSAGNTTLSMGGSTLDLGPCEITIGPPHGVQEEKTEEEIEKEQKELKEGINWLYGL